MVAPEQAGRWTHEALLVGNDSLSEDQQKIIADRCNLRRGNVGAGRGCQPQVLVQNDAATQALVAAVKHHVLAGCRGSLRQMKLDVYPAVVKASHVACRRHVPMAYSGVKIEAVCDTGRLSRQPAQVASVELLSQQRRMPGTLHDDQGIALEILGGDEPRCLETVVAPANVQPRTLSERVERHAVMLPDLFAGRSQYRSWRYSHMLRQKLPERALANKADSRRRL